MPLLTLRTNQTLNSDDSQSLLTELSKQVATMLNKPESYVMVIIQDQQSMIFGGNEQPCALLELKSLGLPEQQCGDYSATLCKLIHQQLNIDTRRIYIEFSNPERHLWGWDEKTF